VREGDARRTRGSWDSPPPPGGTASHRNTNAGPSRLVSFHLVFLTVWLLIQETGSTPEWSFRVAGNVAANLPQIWAKEDKQ